MNNRPSSERTKSRRWRAGTRKNKRYPVTHIQICPEPHRCLVHVKAKKFHPPAEPQRIRLTRCEQQWVDDVKAGRVHLHTGANTKQMSESREWAILALRRRINTKRFADAGGTVNEASRPVMVTSNSSAINAGIRAMRQRLDISDRWYPRG